MSPVTKLSNLRRLDRTLEEKEEAGDRKSTMEGDICCRKTLSFRQAAAVFRWI